ncbi:type IX secretion system membrane protein, PorP/SprF family [Spirosomataceae bacterium TFI 002]|nr:type IX secretion system membrane protein, PorP/SprF family [Spirosomataceae bacterium TFI 002]
MKIKILGRRLMKFVAVALFCLLGTEVAFAQVDPQFSQYIFNQFYLNPAAAGLGSKTEITAIYRNQWTGYTGTFDAGGAPTTQILSANAPVSFLKGGLGVYITNDQIGGGSINRNFKLSYAMHKRFGPSTISAGVGVGSHSRILDGGVYRPREGDDPSIPNGRISQSNLDVDLGVLLSNPGYQLGVSLKHINQPSYSFGTATGESVLPRTLNINANVLIGLSYTLDVQPMLLIKSDFNTVSTEAGALVKYNSRYWAGVNYRWQDAASFLIGGRFLNDALSLGYALDYVVFGTTAKAPLSHEILLSYALKPPRSGKKSIIRTPRYSY